MALLIHMARYEVVERTEASKEVIATTACGMYVGERHVSIRTSKTCDMLVLLNTSKIEN